jgi:hypothetical protein
VVEVADLDGLTLGAGLFILLSFAVIILARSRGANGRLLAWRGLPLTGRCAVAGGLPPRRHRHR